MVAGPVGSGAMAGVRILELAEGIAGEYCAKLLADLGAEVIKVERPGGSPTRGIAPFGAGAAPENSALFAYLNTNKRSLVLDLGAPDGRSLLDRLLPGCHVVIDDHEPGWLAGLGLDEATRRDRWPGITVCSITPYGQEPAQYERHAEDLNVFHAGGWGFHTPSGGNGSKPPLKGAGRYLVSYEAGLDAALCIASAILDTEQGAQGRFIDIAKKRVMYSRLDYVLAPMIVGETDSSTGHTGLDLGGPATIMPCKDGFVYVWLSDETAWRELQKMIGDAAWMDEDFPYNWLMLACTPERVERTRFHLSQWLAGQEKHALSREAQQRGIMIVPINNPEDLLACEQFRFRGYFSSVDHPVLGAAHYPTVPYRMSATPASIDRPAPLLGEQSAVILAELGETA